LVLPSAYSFSNTPDNVGLLLFTLVVRWKRFDANSTFSVAKLALYCRRGFRWGWNAAGARSAVVAASLDIPLWQSWRVYPLRTSEPLSKGSVRARMAAVQLALKAC